MLKPRGFEKVQNENDSATYSGKHSTCKMHVQKAWDRAVCLDIVLSLCVSETQRGN